MIKIIMKSLKSNKNKYIKNNINQQLITKKVKNKYSNQDNGSLVVFGKNKHIKPPPETKTKRINTSKK